MADFIGRQIEGLIIVPSASSADHLGPDRIGRLPVVLASRRVYGLELDTVVLDDVGGAFRGTSHLLDAGHRRIGYLGNVLSVFTGQRRYSGYERALAEHGLEPDPDLVHRDQQDVESAGAALARLLDLPDPPTAIFSANNRNTIGAMSEIGRRIRAGADPSRLPALVGFDDFELADLSPVPLAVIAHDPRQLGRRDRPPPLPPPRIHGPRTAPRPHHRTPRHPPHRPPLNPSPPSLPKPRRPVTNAPVSAACRCTRDGSANHFEGSGSPLPARLQQSGSAR